MSVAKGIALITGSAQGIGRSIALRLAKDGFNIALNDVSSKRDQLRAVADDVEKIGRKSLLVPGDVSAENEVKGMVHEAVKELGSLDVMVANAGVCTLRSLTSTGVDEWEHTMNINARGLFLCYKHAAEQMIKQGRGGRIIGASSAAGKMGFPMGAPYSASKWAVRGLTQSAAWELGQYGITVNAYAPGLIRTPLTDYLLTIIPNLKDVCFTSYMTSIAEKPIKLDGRPEDVANTVSFLASKEAYYVTGQCISVDGGMAMS